MAMFIGMIALMLGVLGIVGAYSEDSPKDSVIKASLACIFCGALLLGLSSIADAITSHERACEKISAEIRTLHQDLQDLSPPMSRMGGSLTGTH